MTTKNVLFRTAGETGSDLFTELEGVVISSLGGITLRCRRPDGGSLTKGITIDDDAGGLFHIVWDPDDLIEGDTKIEYVIVDAGGKVDRLPQKAPLIIRARAQV